MVRKDMARFEDYVYDGTIILKNKLGIKNFENLKAIEERMIIEKLTALYIHPLKGNFDALHLKTLHKYLFGDLYDFAGKYRDIEMFKDQTSYLDYHEIENKLPKVLEEYKNKKVATSSTFEMGLFLANFYKSIIYVHPFRDGNSRTTREFLREFVLEYYPEYELDYSLMDKENFKLALKESDNYSINLLAYEFYKALVKVNIKSK